MGEIPAQLASQFQASLECNGTGASRQFKVEISAQTYKSNDCAQGVNSFMKTSADYMQSEMHIQDHRPFRSKMRKITREARLGHELRYPFFHWKRRAKSLRARAEQYCDQKKLPLGQDESDSEIANKKCTLPKIKPTILEPATGKLVANQPAERLTAVTDKSAAPAPAADALTEPATDKPVANKSAAPAPAADAPTEPATDRPVADNLLHLHQQQTRPTSPRQTSLLLINLQNA